MSSHFPQNPQKTFETADWSKFSSPLDNDEDEDEEEDDE